jgi:CBS domain-containing protein
MTTPAVKRTAVRRVSVLSADGTDATVRTVYCPRRERSEAFEKCCGCSHLRHVDVADDGEHGTVDCAVTAPPTNGKAKEPSLRDAAAHARLVDVLGDDVLCVMADVTIGDAAALMLRSNLRALPVVDQAQKLVGMLSQADLVRARERAAGDAVEKVMTPLAHGLPEDAPLAYAISLMAFEGLHEVPAVASDGRVVGLLSSVDALRWVARGLGYATPSKPAQ